MYLSGNNVKKWDMEKIRVFHNNRFSYNTIISIVSLSIVKRNTARDFFLLLILPLILINNSGQLLDF